MINVGPNAVTKKNGSILAWNARFYRNIIDTPIFFLHRSKLLAQLVKIVLHGLNHQIELCISRQVLTFQFPLLKALDMCTKLACALCPWKIFYIEGAIKIERAFQKRSCNQPDSPDPIVLV